MESAPDINDNSNNNADKVEFANINIITSSNDGYSSRNDLSYLSDYNVFQHTSPKNKANNNNINYVTSNYCNNSFDSDVSGNSFHSCKTPQPCFGFEQFTSQRVYETPQNQQDNINYIINNLNPNINNQQCCPKNNQNVTNCHYSSFSPLRPQIKTRYSSNNLIGNNMKRNIPFLTHTNSNNINQVKNFQPSTFSTFVRANSNKPHHSTNSLFNVIDDHQGMINSPMMSPNTSGNNLMFLDSPYNNSNNNNNSGFILNHQSNKNERNFFTPQAPKKGGNNNILQFRGSGALNNRNNNTNHKDNHSNKKVKKSKEPKNDNNNKNNNRDKNDLHNTSSNSANTPSKKKNLDIPRNKIHLESILRQKDKRTTIMIRHIPNKYTLKLFSEEINKVFLNKYDLLYLPVDVDNHCNLGFGFINFIDPIHIIAFYDKYFGKKWEKFNSDKICELAYAKVQGKDDLLKHIQQSGNTSHTDMPVYLTYNSSEENKKNVSIELPMKFLQAFLNFYPYSLYRVVSYDKFIVDSFYNF